MALNQQPQPRDPRRVILFAGLALLAAIAITSGVIRISRQGGERLPASIDNAPPSPEPSADPSFSPPPLPAGSKPVTQRGNGPSGAAAKVLPKAPQVIAAGDLQELLRNSQKPWQVDYPQPGARFPRAIRQGSYLIQSESDEARAQDLLMTYSEKTFGVPYSRLQHASTHEGEQTYISYEQIENDLPILGARVVMVFENRSLVRVMNDLIPREGNAPSMPKVLFSDAERIALAAAEPFRLNADQGSNQTPATLSISSNPRLAYLPSSGGKLTLVYQTGVAVEGSEPRQLLVLIDARTGDVLKVRDTLKR